jgi:hypothetical protein
MKWINRVFKAMADQWIIGRLSPEQTPSQLISQEIVAHEAYVSVTLRSMRTVFKRVGRHRVYGTVQSICRLAYQTEGDATFYRVTTPEFLRNVDPEHRDRIILLNLPLIGPLPYIGGGLELEIGLCSVQAVELTQSYLTLLEELTNAAGVTFTTIARPFIEPLRRGIDLLTDSTATTNLEIGVAATINPVQNGWYVAIAAPKGSIDLSQLKIDEQDSGLLDSQGNPIRDYPYFVFSIDSSNRRDDWSTLPEIVEAYANLDLARRSKRPSDIEEALGGLRQAISFSPNLIHSDAMHLRKVATEIIRQKLGATPTSAGELPELPPLHELPMYEGR